MTRRIFAIAFCVALFAAIHTPAAWAINDGPTMWITIKNGPVEIPGRVLGPGRYEFTYVDVYRQVVDVRSADGAQIGFFEMKPADREYKTDKAKVDLTRVPGSPDRIKDFFFGGEAEGSAFIYPQQNPAESVSAHPKLRP